MRSQDGESQMFNQEKKAPMGATVFVAANQDDGHRNRPRRSCRPRPGERIFVRSIRRNDVRRLFQEEGYEKPDGREACFDKSTKITLASSGTKAILQDAGMFTTSSKPAIDDRVSKENVEVRDAEQIER